MKFIAIHSKAVERIVALRGCVQAKKDILQNGHFLSHSGYFSVLNLKIKF